MNDENFEHEVIDRLKSLEFMDFDFNAVEPSYVSSMLQARDIILDSYKEEKEKNEELEKKIGKDLDVVYMKATYDERDKWKNKIKEKIEKVKNSDENYTFKNLTSEDIRRTIITNLRELLEEV